MAKLTDTVFNVFIDQCSLMFGPPNWQPVHDPRPSTNQTPDLDRRSTGSSSKKGDVNRIWGLPKALVEDRQEQDKTTLATHDRSACRAQASHAGPGDAGVWLCANSTI
jgi:hypothetical protein